MKHELTCPECHSTLNQWDQAKSSLGKTDTLSATVGQAGFFGFVFGLLSSLLIIKTDIKESTIWKCSSCDLKFTGDKLKPFEWSDYQ